MRGTFNDFLRAAIGHVILTAGFLLNGLLKLRLRSYARNQLRLKRKYQLTSDTPVLPYGPQLEKSVQAIAAKARRSPKFAFTSGSSGRPKRILYTKRRLRMLKFTYNDMFARACRAFGIKRTSLYVFSSLQPDDSLTSLLLDEDGLPRYLATLQAPYRVQRHPAILALVDKYGAAAVRLWILTISNPGVLYSTNPSTISTFFDQLANRWRETSQLIRDWCNNPRLFNADVHKIARRIDSRGSKERLRLIANSDTPVPLKTWAPALEAYICWTGGYVKPFLDRLANYLPATRYQHVPMCSMSTETLETLSYFRNGEVLFVPVAAGVVHEFTEENDGREHLFTPAELEVGKTYAMIVSDPYGLRRYQTNDLFLCRRKINGLPDLVFLRRRGLAYSFTGEKLTAEQLSIVFEQLRRQYPQPLANRYLTCVPSQPSHALPHYKVLLIGDCSVCSSVSHDLLATRCDELLASVNGEYKSKRASGRLGPIEFLQTTVEDFARRVARHGTWESQFKFLPLFAHLWETDSADAAESSVLISLPATPGLSQKNTDPPINSPAHSAFPSGLLLANRNLRSTLLPQQSFKEGS